MNKLKTMVAGIAALSLLAAGGCTFRTEHKVETYHKIDAHIVLDVRKQIEANEDYVESGKSEPVSAAPFTGEVQLAGGGGWLAALALLNPASVAAAQEPERITADARNAALERRRERVKEVEAALKKGYAGETNQGYLELLLEKDEDKPLRPVNKLTEADERNRMDTVKVTKQLVETENADRRVEYRWLDQNSGQTASILKQVESISADVRREKLEEGVWLELPKDKAELARFLEGELGKAVAKKLGKDKVKPELWVQKP